MAAYRRVYDSRHLQADGQEPGSAPSSGSIKVIYAGLSSAAGRLVSRVVSVLDSGAERLGFKSQPRRCRVTVLGKLFTPIVRLLPEVFAPTQSIDHSTSAADQSASVGAVYNVRVERASERSRCALPWYHDRAWPFVHRLSPGQLTISNQGRARWRLCIVHVNQSINQSCIFGVVQVIKSLQDPLEVRNTLPGINDNDDVTCHPPKTSTF